MKRKRTKLWLTPAEARQHEYEGTEVLEGLMLGRDPFQGDSRPAWPVKLARVIRADVYQPFVVLLDARGYEHHHLLEYRSSPDENVIMTVRRKVSMVEFDTS